MRQTWQLKIGQFGSISPVRQPVQNCMKLTGKVQVTYKIKSFLNEEGQKISCAQIFRESPAGSGTVGSSVLWYK